MHVCLHVPHACLIGIPNMLPYWIKSASRYEWGMTVPHEAMSMGLELVLLCWQGFLVHFSMDTCNCLGNFWLEVQIVSTSLWFQRFRCFFKPGNLWELIQFDELSRQPRGIMTRCHSNRRFRSVKLWRFMAKSKIFFMPDLHQTISEHIESLFICLVNVPVLGAQ